MSDATKFWNKIARRYAERPVSDPALYEHTLARTQSYLTPQDRVLELGSGTGTTALRLASSVQHIHGTDAASEMVTIAREKATAEGVTNVTFEVQSAEDAVARSEPFDAVLAFNFLHLLDAPEQVIADVYHLLPVGGYFISKTVCISDKSLGLKRFAFRLLIPVLRMVGKAPALRPMTFAQIETMVAGAGFEIVETGTFPALSRYVVAQRR